MLRTDIQVPAAASDVAEASRMHVRPFLYANADMNRTKCDIALTSVPSGPYILALSKDPRTTFGDRYASTHRRMRKSLSRGPASALTEPDPNSDLLRRVAASERDALAELYERYGPMVYRTAYGIMRNPADAEDVHHEVFLGLSSALAKYEGRGSFEGWLRKATVRTALMTLRRRRIGAEVSIDQAAPVAAQPDGITHEDRILLEKAVRQLSGVQLEVFLLRAVEGYSYDEIASLTGISSIACRSRYFRAMRKIVKVFRPER